MSFCNISHPDIDEKYRQYHDRIADLEGQLKRAVSRAEAVEDKLSSIFDRVREQVTVWLDYPDNKRIYLVGVLKEPEQKDTPLI